MNSICFHNILLLYIVIPAPGTYNVDLYDIKKKA